MAILSYLFTRCIVFVAVALAIFAVGLVFLDGKFSTTAFWWTYGAIEVGIHSFLIWFLADSHLTHGSHVGGIALNSDGMPSAQLLQRWTIEAERDEARRALVDGEYGPRED